MCRAVAYRTESKRTEPNQITRLVVLAKFAKGTVRVRYGTFTFFMTGTACVYCICDESSKRK